METRKIVLSDSMRAFLTDKAVMSVSEQKIKKDFVYCILDDVQLKNQKVLALELSKNIPLNNNSVGFVKGKSYLDFLNPHRESMFFIRMDIKNFFHSIKPITLRTALTPYFDENTTPDSSEKIIDLLLNKITYRVPKNSKNKKVNQDVILPMGFPCSPFISNLILRPFDIVISKYCKLNNIRYTRYADDMLFSASHVIDTRNKDLEKKVKSLISDYGLTINTKKTILATDHISLNGYVIDGVNKSIRLSNFKLKKLQKLTRLILKDEQPFSIIGNKMFNLDISKLRYKNANTEAYFEGFCKKIVLNKVKGYRSHIISIYMHGEKNKNINDITTSSHKKVKDINIRSKDKLELLLKRLEEIISTYS